MTNGKTQETEETCGHQIKEENISRAGNLNLRGSFTTLSTIAIQTSRSQIVVSVLQSGSAVHLQLVQIQPGLCEIGSNQEENQILIQDQQQLLDKLQKHEPEVLAAVEKKGKEKPRMRRDGRMTEQKRKQEEEEELKQAMKASLSEGWSLLCRLLKRRLEVLTLTSDFYHRAAEFAVSIDRFEALQIKADEDRLTEVQRSFDSMRKDLLLKSLKVLSSSSVLLQKLRQLQRTEALQRRGGVLQEEEEEEKSSQSSSGAVLRLEELVEKLQDRRQRADQVIRLQLQQAEKVQKTKLSGPHDQNLLDQNLQSGAVSADVQSESRSDQTRNSESEGTSEKFKSGSTSDLQVEFRSDQKPTTQSEGTRNLDLQFGSRSQQGGALQSGSRLDTKPELHLDLESDLDRNRDQKSESRLDGTKNQQSGLKPFMFRNLQHGSRSTLQSDSSSKETKNLSLCSRSDLKCKSASGETRNLKSRFRSGETTETRLEVETVEPVSENHHRSRSEKTRDLQSESRSTESKVLQSGSRLDQQTDSGSQETEDPQSGFRSDLKGRSKSEVPGSRSGMMLESQERTDLRPESGSDQIRKQQLESRLQETKGLQSSFKSVLKTRTSSIVKPGSPSEETGDQESCSRSEVSGSELNLLSEQQQTMQRHSQTKQDVNKLKTHHKAEIQQEQEDLMFSRKYQQRLVKTLQDLNLVLELLDSCTLMDLGSELQTYRLLEHFKQAEPHFKKLDAEVEFTLKSWEHLRGVQAQLEDVEGETERDEDPSELLKLQQTVKNKIQQSEVILNLTRNFHLTANQLELLVQSGPTSSTAGSTGLCGPSEADLSRHLEAKQQIQNLLKTVSTLKTDICAAVTQNGWTGFQVEQLEVRLHTLNSLCTSWLNEAARHEEKLRREQLTHLLHDDVIQLRDSFKELKKRFSNMKFNYLKINDRMRNLKAVRNQLQQVEVYEEKLQALRNRLHGVTTRLESEVKDGGVARQVEDATNELQRQMGEFERSVCEHQKTLDMICRLQQALEEYQFWCEEASATITRVGKFSLECRSTEAVSVLYRQFEKFVWPTVPQQEERISQITELAVRLHGVEEGQRYIEKTVSKHSEMVESIRELSNGLMELEAKLKLESLKQQQNDEKKEVKEEESERKEEKEMEKKERKVKEKKKMKLMEPKDNRSTQEAADMYELKETGHTPELTAEHDGKEAAAANRKLEESQEADRQTAESESSFSCSPLEVNQPAVTLQSQSQHVAAEPQATPPQTVTDPAFEVQNPFQKDKQAASTFCGSNLIPPQDASAHVEPHQHETTMEDFFSNDEYDCASPDDISLPPLAETPESIMFQSDVEESFCFSSHSVHISHVSHQCLTQAEQTGTGSAAGVVPQHRESGLTEDGPVPSVSRHSNTRFRSESRSYLQSPSTAPAPRLFSSTLCTVLKTRESSTNNIPQTADPSLGSPEPGLPYRSNSVSGGIKQGRSKDNDVSKRRSSSLSTLQDLSQSPQRFSGPDPDIHNSPAGDAGFHKFSPHFIQNNSVISKNNSTVVVHKDTTCPQDDSPEASEITLQSTATLEEMSPPQLSTGAWSGLNQEAPSIQTSEKTSSSSTNSHLTTAVPQETRFCGSFPSDRLETPSKRDATDQTEEHSSPQPNSITICSSKRSLQTVSSVHESLTFTQAQQRVHGPGMSPNSPARPAAPSQPEAQAQALADSANLHVTPPSSSPHLLTSPQDPDICQPVAIREEIRLTPQIQGPPLPPPPPHGQAESLLLGKPSRPGPPCFTRPLSQATVMEGSPVTLEVEVMGNPEPELTCLFVVTETEERQMLPPNICSGDWGSSCSLCRLTCCHHGRSRFTSGDESTGRPAPAPPSVESESPSVDLAPPPGELSLPSVGADHPTSYHDSRQLMERSGGDKWLVVEVFDIMSEDWNSWFGTLCVLLWLLYLIIV